MKRLALSLCLAMLCCIAVPSRAKAAFAFQDISNPHDLTFTQLLGINNASTIAGYFGSGAVGHPNKGFTLVLPSTFTNENFPGSVQTQVVRHKQQGRHGGLLD
jgi:hypothetical protein